MGLASNFLLERIEATEALIVKYEEALSAVADTGQTYTFDTGQTRVSVTKGNMGSVRITLDSLYNQWSTLCARAGLSGRVIGRMV